MGCVNVLQQIGILTRIHVHHYDCVYIRREGQGLINAINHILLMSSLTSGSYAFMYIHNVCLLCVCLHTFRKGTVVNTTVLVFIASLLMGFSRICGSPEMIIVGRFITGIHSGTQHTHTPASIRPCTLPQEYAWNRKWWSISEHALGWPYCDWRVPTLAVSVFTPPKSKYGPFSSLVAQQILWRS